MSVDLSGEITAIATAVLAVFAIVTAYYARKAFWQQSRKVSLLLEENKRQDIERRRAQASRVFIGVPYDPPHLVSPYARNLSEFPMSGTQLWYSGPQRLTGPDELGVILPGNDSSGERALPHTDALRSAVLTFWDAQGVRWIRLPDGTFREQAHATVRESVLEALGRPMPTQPAQS